MYIQIQVTRHTTFSLASLLLLFRIIELALETTEEEPTVEEPTAEEPMAVEPTN